MTYAKERSQGANLGDGKPVATPFLGPRDLKLGSTATLDMVTVVDAVNMFSLLGTCYVVLCVFCKHFFVQI